MYATADAARIGGGLYLYILNALTMYVSDPSPMVALAAKESLEVAGVHPTLLRQMLAGDDPRRATHASAAVPSPHPFGSSSVNVPSRLQ
eukprot:9103247-Pyramimonas_sp.AAC.1